MSFTCFFNAFPSKSFRFCDPFTYLFKNASKNYFWKQIAVVFSTPQNFSLHNTAV